MPTILTAHFDEAMFAALLSPRPVNLTHGRQREYLQVLYRLGPYDHETIYFDHWRAPVRKSWYYIPESRSGWITEIVFDAGGHVQSLERTRPYP
ncbi:MAG: hypothetical protein ACREU8_04235 [Gammaproteobacteria bacterium]